MATGGLTSQPIGHYDFCRLNPGECSIRPTNLAPTPMTDGLMRKLISVSAKVNAAETFDHQTALMWAANERQPAMVRLLISRGADVNARSRVHDNDPRVTAEPRVRYDPSGGMTPLMFAAREGCLDCAKALVEAGARIDDYDPDNITPLIFATLNAHFDTAAYLVNAGANVNRWDFWGRTPLWAAVDFDTLPRGGRPDRPSTDDTTPLDLIDLLLARMACRLYPTAARDLFEGVEAGAAGARLSRASRLFGAPIQLGETDFTRPRLLLPSMANSSNGAYYMGVGAASTSTFAARTSADVVADAIVVAFRRNDDEPKIALPR